MPLLLAYAFIDDTQFEAHKAALTMELPEELPAQVCS